MIHDTRALGTLWHDACNCVGVGGLTALHLGGARGIIEEKLDIEVMLNYATWMDWIDVFPK